ncbi:hypothetical protein O6H91_15G028700 [Diphasiastrum complanatum]|uniref:Uncharacterized protein n=2 Tax=Diphasiastrum complanatum TaxID=34168 RepID=A0ACC2BG78_DIPCM|nr:hypothetical protein O6H91_15G014400 [Diphasiastrum complanatum]KAJ7528993.1 hypothetical protein O6H91_15G028700 [Diphasiastrum complanatum]
MASFRGFRGNDAFGSEAWKALCRVREAAPLIQCITNFVSMDIMANTVLAAGASPAMVHAIEEIAEFTALANAVCINVGTLSPEWIFAMKAAASRANDLKKPWVLDPVGVGATTFRTEKCLELIALRPVVIRGNASEIIAAIGASVEPTRGVDSTLPSKDALEAAKELARASQSIVAVTGAVDLVTDGKRVLGVSNGVALMQRITATGCAVTALIAAFVAVHPGRPLEAAAFALALFGLAGEIGMEKASGPASLRVHLLDALHSLDEVTVISRIKIAQI